MALSYNDNLKLTLSINAQNSVDIGTAKYTPTYTYESTFTNGTGSSQAEIVFTDERTLAASTSEDLDLYGSLADQFGNTINGATLKRLIVEASPTNGDNILVGGAASNTFAAIFDAGSNKVKVFPGGLFAWSVPGTGATITNSSADLLRIENADSGAEATYKIIMVFTD